MLLDPGRRRALPAAKRPAPAYRRMATVSLDRRARVFLLGELRVHFLPTLRYGAARDRSIARRSRPPLTLRETFTGVQTPQGHIRAEFVVNCGGMSARQIGELASVHVAWQAVEHCGPRTPDLTSRTDLTPAGRHRARASLMPMYDPSNMRIRCCGGNISPRACERANKITGYGSARPQAGRLPRGDARGARLSALVLS